MLRRSWRIILLSAAFLSIVRGNWNDTSTGIDLDKLRPFPLSKIRSGHLKSGARVSFDGISAVAARGDMYGVQIRGKGKSGKRWEAHLSFLDEVWRGDLDGNGTQDYVFFSGGPYFNGATTPLYSLSILLMDREGMPVPFFTVLDHGENGEGIRHLVDLAGDGHAELLIRSYDEDQSDPHVGAFCSGHWISQLFRFRNLGAEEIRGTVGGIKFPLVHDWTYRGSECPYEEKSLVPVAPATLYEHGTSAHGEIVTKITRPEDESGVALIDPAMGCESIRSVLVLYDRPRIREIAFPNFFGSYSATLAVKIWRDGAQVRLRGINRPAATGGDCSANLLWAN